MAPSISPHGDKVQVFGLFALGIDERIRYAHSREVMSTYWARNPFRSIRQLKAAGIDRYAFDRALLATLGRDAHEFMREHFLGSGIDPEFLLMGEQGCGLYDLRTPFETPKAVYPVWFPDMEVDVLEDLLRDPVGLNPDFCFDESVPITHRPVVAQDHVVVVKLPSTTDGLGEKRASEIGSIIKSYPEAAVHLWGAITYNKIFNYGCKSFDWDCFEAGRSQIFLPNGIILKPNNFEQVYAHKDWLELVGYSLYDVLDDRELRVSFHIASIQWACENYSKELRIKRRYSPDPEQSEIARAKYKGATDKRTNFRNKTTVAKRSLLFDTGVVGDKFICDHCIFRTSCKHARAGCVCSLDGSETLELSKYFGTRDASQLIDGLDKLLKSQVERAEKAMQHEEDSDEGPDPEVTRQLNSVFANGVKLAKLIDPSLNGKTQININSGNTNIAAISAADPRQMVAAVVQALEQRGIARNEITNEMIQGVLTKMAYTEPEQAIEAQYIEHKDGK